ncbi:unnamed protein product [Penicillium olsonii]|nr:unnamed protein product [Penicillium olsonii]
MEYHLTSTGRADTESESAFQTARREAYEEIGLPDTATLPPPFRVEHLCELPANLAKTELVVRPCVALLHGYDPGTGLSANPESLIPTLDAREVAAVFTAPLGGFLKSRLGREEWYRGAWSLWHSEDWRSKFIFYFVNCVIFVLVLFILGFVKEYRVEMNTWIVTPWRLCFSFPSIFDFDFDFYWNYRPDDATVHQFFVRQKTATATEVYRIFGMTARILVDAARLGYAQEPDFEHNSHFGDEEMIAKLRRLGRLSAVRKPSDQLTRQTMEKAAKLS